MIYAALAFLVVLQIADIWTTWLFLKAGKREGWAISRWLLDKIGWLGVIILKAALTIAVLVFALTYPAAPEAWIGVGVLTVWYLWAVGGNLMLLDVL